MKMKKAFLSLLIAFVGTSAMAQTGVASGTAYGHGQDSIHCRQNLSLFSGFSKTKNYKDAYEPWTKAIKECPASSKNIYIYGAKILRWKISQEQDLAKRKALLDELMTMYDMRIKYFGNSRKYGPDYIMGKKAADYVALGGDNIDYKQLYAWAKPIVDEAGKGANPELLYYFVAASKNVAVKDTSKRETYINDYLKAAEALDAQLEVSQGNEKAIKRIEAYKSPLDQEFASSGVASCDMLQKIYTVEKIEKNKENKNFLAQTCNLFQNAGCDAPAYFTASRYLFDIEPSARAAMGLAGKAIQDHKYSEAKDYLNKAVELTDKVKEKIMCYELLATLSTKQGSASSARAYCNKALELNPKSGSSLVTLATLLAGQADNIFPGDKVKQKAVYFLVIDKLRHAAAVDPSVSSRAYKLIGQYKAYLPSAADIFMHPDLKQGASFTVPGYGSTTIK